MKKFFSLILSLMLVFSFTACSDGKDDATTVSSDSKSVVETIQPEKAEAEVDYTAYAQLVNAYFEEYGPLIEEQAYEGGEVNTAGFNYAELIDFDNDGVLELVLIGVSDEMNTIENGGSALDLYYDDYYLKDTISIYTLSDDGEAVLLGTCSPSCYGNGGVEFGVEYAKSKEQSYFLDSYRGDGETVTYYQLLDGAFIEHLSYETFYDYLNEDFSATLNGEACEMATLETVLQEKGEVEIHKISWLTLDEYKALIVRNEKTFCFLEQYAPINRALEQTERTTMQGIDYAPYSALLQAYTLDYNVVHTGLNEYDVVGMTLNPTTYGASTTAVDASGFCYANLVDLDYDGILELILVAYPSQECYDALENLYVAKIYTISPDFGLTFLGSFPLTELESPVTHYLGLEYSVCNEKIYIVESEMYQMGNGAIRYLSLMDGWIDVEAYFEVGLEDELIYYYEGMELSEEEFNEIAAGYGDKEQHYLINLEETDVEKLQQINDATFAFLADYPVHNFTDTDGIYNDGQFYFEEYLVCDYYYPPFDPVVSYYQALTMRDYDSLEQLTSSEEVESIRYCHTNEMPYVPGYILSELEGYVDLDDIEDTALREDITNFQNEIQTEDNQVYVVRCTVNEVLDPHTVQLGLQEAGGMYETYFIVSTENPEEGNWKIEAIFDDRFY